MVLTGRPDDVGGTVTTTSCVVTTVEVKLTVTNDWPEVLVCVGRSVVVTVTTGMGVLEAELDETAKSSDMYAVSRC